MTGKYADLCGKIREDLDADAAVVIVAGGKLGNGSFIEIRGKENFSQVMSFLPGFLRKMADDIESGMAKSKN